MKSGTRASSAWYMNRESKRNSGIQPAQRYCAFLSKMINRNNKILTKKQAFDIMHYDFYTLNIGNKLGLKIQPL